MSPRCSGGSAAANFICKTCLHNFSKDGWKFTAKIQSQNNFYHLIFVQTSVIKCIKMLICLLSVTKEAEISCFEMLKLNVTEFKTQNYLFKNDQRLFSESFT